MERPIRIDPTIFYSDEALGRMGLSAGAITKARRDGSLRHTRRGGRNLYVGRWVIAWLTGEADGVAEPAQMAGA